MINLQISSRLASPVGVRTLRFGAHAFWVLFALQALGIGVLVSMVIASIPSQAALSRSDEIEQVRTFILNGDSVSDPLIEITPNVIGRSSSVRGLQLGGQTYFYYFEGRNSYDPFSRGKVGKDQIELVLRDDAGDNALVIYRMLR